IEEEGSGQRKLRDAEMPDELAQVAVGIEAIDEQDVAVLKGRLLRGTDDLEAPEPGPLDRQDVEPVRLAQTHGFECAAAKRRCVRDAQAKLAILETVLRD